MNVPLIAGDSGGPLTGVLTRTNTLMLLGIISLGFKCDLNPTGPGFRKPGLYTNVSKYGKWIDQKTGSRTYNNNNNLYLKRVIYCICI